MGPDPPRRPLAEAIAERYHLCPVIGPENPVIRTRPFARIVRALLPLVVVAMTTPILDAQVATAPAREPTSFRDAFVLARDALAAGDHQRVRQALRGALTFAPD